MLVAIKREWQRQLLSVVKSRHKNSSFPLFRNFLPNSDRILPALTFNGCNPLYVNAGRILPWFGRKLRNIGKVDCLDSKLIQNCLRIQHGTFSIMQAFHSSFKYYIFFIYLLFTTEYYYGNTVIRTKTFPMFDHMSK